MRTLLFLFVMIFMVTKVHAEDELQERARLIPPEVAKAYLKEGNPKIICVESHKMSALVSVDPPHDNKMVVAKVSQEYGLETIKIYRLDGKLVTPAEAQKLFRQPTKVILQRQQFDKTNEYYSYFDQQLLVISLDVRYPGDVIMIPDEAQGK